MIFEFQLPAKQARIWVYCWCYQGRALDLDRGPIQECHFFASTSAHAINLSPTLAGASAVECGTWRVSGGGGTWRVSGGSVSAYVSVNVQVQCACECACECECACACACACVCAWKDSGFDYYYYYYYYYCGCCYYHPLALGLGGGP